MEKNEALTTLEKMNIILRDSVEVSINGMPFVFHLDHAAYDAFLNDVNAKNKVTPMKDYLLTIVEPQQRKALLDIINLPDLALNLVEKVNDVLIPKFEIIVKK